MMQRPFVLASASMFAMLVGVLAACTATPVPSSGGDDDSDDDSKGSKTSSSSSSSSSSTSSSPSSSSTSTTSPTDTSGTDSGAPSGDTAACGQKASADECYECCDDALPAQADIYNGAFDDCECGASACATACAQSYCAQNYQDPTPGDACDTCLNSHGDACDQQAGTVACAGGKCDQLFACYTPCDAKQQ